LLIDLFHSIFSFKESEIRPAKVLEMVRRKTSSNPAVVAVRPLPERHEPDGGEDGVHSLLLEKTDADEHWSDWEAEEDDFQDNKQHPEEEVELEPLPLSDFSLAASSLPDNKKPELPSSPVKVATKRPPVGDLSALEIQIKSREDEIDYFADMEPTITSTPAVFAPVAEPPPTVAAIEPTSRLDFNVQSHEAKDEDDGWNWDD
jgi:hypothetical protein